MKLNHLNDRQREAVRHGDGPLLILAGAGSGKTSTMTYRIAHLLRERAVKPTQILGLSFTNKAARELKERVQKISQSGTRGLIISTFHSLCVRILREHAAKIGYQSDFSILDSHDQKDILKGIFRNVRIDDRKFDLDVILFEIGKAKNALLTADQAVEGFFANKRLNPNYAEAAAVSFEKYAAQLKSQNAMDFDDLLYNSVQLLEKCPDVRDALNRRFRYLLVDEYQDTNPTQFRILRLLTEQTQNICVVGDDDQSIYSWRGADAAHILNFANQYPGARIITLDQNYRSTATILKAANSVISKNPKRHPKQLWSDLGEGESLQEFILEDDPDEGEFVAEEILAIQKRQNRPWKHFAVLYRSNVQSRVFEEALRRNRIPYRMVGGYSFLDRKEIKDVLSYWRLIVNPRDDASLRRILNWPARGIGRQTLEALCKTAFDSEKALIEVLPSHPKAAPVSQLILDLRAALQGLPADPAQVSEWAKRSFERIGVRAGIEAEEDDPVTAQRRIENAEELAHSLGQMRLKAENPPTSGLELLREFLGDLILQAQDEEDDSQKDAENADQVTLLTLHGAKGLEYPVVFLVGMEEGFIPHKRTIEEAADFSEERRLCYVGITRAKEQLYLTRARNRIRFGKAVPRTRSRFLDEIPGDCIVTQDRSSGPSPDENTSEASRAAHETKVKDFLASIRARLEGGVPAGPGPKAGA